PRRLLPGDAATPAQERALPEPLRVDRPQARPFPPPRPERHEPRLDRDDGPRDPGLLGRLLRLVPRPRAGRYRAPVVRRAAEGAVRRRARVAGRGGRGPADPTPRGVFPRPSFRPLVEDRRRALLPRTRRERRTPRDVDLPPEGLRILLPQEPSSSLR